MIQLSAKARIAMGMAMLVVTILMLINFSGVVPNPHQVAISGRCAVSELVALHVRPVILEKDLIRIQGLLEAVVERNEEILSGAVRRGDGKLVAMVGNHEEIWDAKATVSDDRQVYVPLNTNGEEWGRVEICFKPLGRRGLLGLIDTPSGRLIGLTGLLCWLAFYLYLRKMLNHLDPSKAVPDRVRNALNTLGDGLLVLDRDGRIRLANQSFADSIGSDPQALLGIEASSLPWIVESEEGDSTEFPWAQAIEQGTLIHGMKLRYQREDTRDTVFLTSCSPVPGSDGSYKGVLVNLDDATELEQTKQQLSEAKDAAEAANAAKSSFLANMSHEIRTPMNAILGFTEVLRRDIEHDEQKRRKHLNTIHSSGTHLLNLINDILDLSKVEADRLEVESIPCQAHAVVADVVTVMAVRAEEKGIRLDSHFEGKIPETIHSDPARLRQVLTNLIGNAIKFTEEGGVRILTNLDTEGERPQLVFQVVDTGIGMTEEAAAKIFDPFSQADASVTRRFGGTGLGLSISKRFAEALGGGIRVISEVGVGSVFIVRIDTGPIDGVALIEPSAAELERAVAPDRDSQVELNHLRVLLVDDGEENRELMSVLLDEVGAQYQTATNGLEAVELATQHEWDLILMDMQMPVMDGYTATRTLREQGYELPIIALTAHAMQHAEQECLDAGCSGFLTKPIEFDKLMSTLAEIAGAAPPPDRDDADDRNPRSVATPEILPASLDADRLAADRTPIRSTLMDRGDAFRSIVTEFVGRLPGKFDEMDATLAQSDFAKLKDLGHWLKGSAPNVGLADFAEPAKALEDAALQEDAAAARQALQTIRALAERIVLHDDEPGITAESPKEMPEEPSDEAIRSTLPMHKPRFREIVLRFVDALEPRFEQIEQALDGEDGESLQSLGHALKGAAANCGFPAMATLAGTLEMAGRDRDLKVVPEIVKEMRQLRDRIEIDEPLPVGV